MFLRHFIFSISVAEPTKIIPIECDVAYFCTSGTGKKCEEPLTTTEKPMPQRTKSCSCRKRHP